jgi:hypothetical protein
MFIANDPELNTSARRRAQRRTSSRGKPFLMTWGYKYCAPNGASKVVLTPSRV